MGKGGGVVGDGCVISVCIVTRGLSPLLQSCLASLRSDVGDGPLEVLVGADGDARVRDLVSEYFPDAVVGVFQGAYPGHARNFLVERATGDVLWFLDDDVVVPRGTVAVLRSLIQANPGIDVFGGPHLTPEGSTHFQRVQGAVLASVVGSGPVRRRWGQHPPREADERFFTLCNLAVRRRAMLPFPPELLCAEEVALLNELRSNGSVMLYDPALAIYHERRGTLRGFGAQMRKYGIGRGQVIRRTPASTRAAYLTPSALLLYLLTAPLLLLASPMAALPAGVYAAAVAAQATKIGLVFRHVRDGLLSAGLIVVLHACYGAGVLQGMVARPRPRDLAAPATFALVGPDGGLAPASEASTS